MRAERLSSFIARCSFCLLLSEKDSHSCLLPKRFIALQLKWSTRAGGRRNEQRAVCPKVTMNFVSKFLLFMFHRAQISAGFVSSAHTISNISAPRKEVRSFFNTKFVEIFGHTVDIPRAAHRKCNFASTFLLPGRQRQRIRTHRHTQERDAATSALSPRTLSRAHERSCAHTCELTRGGVPEKGTCTQKHDAKKHR